MPKGLSLAKVRALHDEQLSRYGGRSGLRNPGLLEGALAQPTQELFGQWRHRTVPAQAAAYLYHLFRAHAFTDGNKRTAQGCALVWLDLHDLRLSLTPRKLFDLTLEVAQGSVMLAEIAALFEAHAQGAQK